MLSIETPSKTIKIIAKRAKSARLAANYSRKVLAEKSNVPESTIRHFENTGKISIESLVKLAWVLDDLTSFNQLFPAKPAVSIDMLVTKKRMRGRSSG